MISRKTARALAEVYEEAFKRYVPGGGYRILRDELYDFLFDHDYNRWFCNRAHTTKIVKGFLMKLHTGESVVEVTKDWSWEQRQLLGQRKLHGLAEDILNHYHNPQGQFSRRITKITESTATALLRGLELDGYVYKDSRLLAPEEDVLDVQEETGVLEALYTSLNLDNKETAFHHLKLSEEHYLDQKWDDSISNSRKYLESILQETATAHSDRIKGSPLPKKVHGSPYKVRDYLQNEGLLEAKEKEALAKIYGLLSETGGHPYMARNDQARLLRHLALTFSQFVMLRLQGSLAKVV